MSIVVYRCLFRPAARGTFSDGIEIFYSKKSFILRYRGSRTIGTGCTTDEKMGIARSIEAEGAIIKIINNRTLFSLSVLSVFFNIGIWPWLSRYSRDLVSLQSRFSLTLKYNYRVIMSSVTPAVEIMKRNVVLLNVQFQFSKL